MDNVTLVKSASAPPKNQHTFYPPTYSQEFSFSPPIIRYILKNPTGRAWKKMIQTCKYFYSKNPVFPVGTLCFDNSNKCLADGKYFDYRNKDIHGLWLNDSIFAWAFDVPSNPISIISSKIKKCDIQILDISLQDLTWKEYQFLTSSKYLKYICLVSTTIKFCNGETVTCDKFLENLNNLESFYMYCKNDPKIFTTDAITNLNKTLCGLKNLHNFKLSNLTESFDLFTFTDFVMKNEHISVGLNYSTNLHISTDYIKILSKFVITILYAPIKKIPYINFPGFSKTSGFRELMLKRARKQF